MDLFYILSTLVSIAVIYIYENAFNGNFGNNLLPAGSSGGNGDIFLDIVFPFTNTYFNRVLAQTFSYGIMFTPFGAHYVNGMRAYKIISSLSTLHNMKLVLHSFVKNSDMESKAKKEVNRFIHSADLETVGKAFAGVIDANKEVIPDAIPAPMLKGRLIEAGVDLETNYLMDQLVESLNDHYRVMQV
ncbi:hypothetical protein WICPIJ_009123 [Wickerhamomyces pijperi]|uniref:Uncharacterized protein n=1 Tax=Wickerhamomyces pijperi TaxID=599730 RepID=A0A9P8PQB0_WICPI|nr:hypothetical protein WICPIJ_009123 [Wickerhamomyces pijperi]